MTRNDICARYFGSDQTQCSTHSAPFDSPSESRCSAARLSHDRGADADAAYDAFMARWKAVVLQPSLGAYDTLVMDLMAALQALSVPAPTLPAPCKGVCEYDDDPHYHEALRDAV